MLADIDNFKKINDTFGHPVGDKILATVAIVIRTNVRKDVFVARSGGEEFAMHRRWHYARGGHDDPPSAFARALETRTFKQPALRRRLRPGHVLAGLCHGARRRAIRRELYASADIALYYAKTSGRNRSVFFEDGMKKDYIGKSWLIYKR